MACAGRPVMSGTGDWSGWGIRPIVRRRGAGDQARTAARAQQKRADQLQLLDQLKRQYPALVAGEPGQQLSEDEVKALFETISDAGSNHQLRDRHNFLVRGLSRGVQECGWDIPVPAPISVYRAEKEVLTPELFRELAPYRAMLQRFWDHLNGDYVPGGSTTATGGRQTGHQDLDAGQLLFSAITRGMLLNHYWATAWPEAISRGVFFAGKADRQPVSLEFRMADMAPRGSSLNFAKTSMVRRWFPDTVTALLLQRWYRNYGRSWPDERPGVLLSRYLKHVGLNPPAGSQLEWLMTHARTAAMVDIPHFVAHYAQSRDLGPSLTSECHERLWRGLAPARKLIPIEPTDIANRAPGSVNLPKMPETQLLSGQLASLNRLRDCVRVKDRYEKKRPTSAVTKALRDMLKSGGETPPLVILLAQWLKQRLTAEGSEKQTLKVSSAARYLSSIGKSLVIASVDQPNVATYAPSDWQALYERAMQESASNNEAVYRCARLAEFHHWLVDQFDVPPVNIQDERLDLRNVDAQILTPREFMRARAWLAQSADARLAAIRELILILGYRCGLRRSEVASLRIQDVPGILKPGCKHPELLVRNNLYATVKSSSSVRRLPLWLFLMDSEMAQLRQWVRLRYSEQHQLSSQALLFCSAGEPLRMLTDREVFAPIQRAMCNASGTEGMRFHHNRHSFATFSLLRLMEPQPGDYIPEQWRLDDDKQNALPRWGECFSELARLGSSGVPTRKHLWALSGWCGHLDPGESMASYLHLIDWLLGAMVRNRRNPELTMVAQASLLGVNPSGIDVIRYRHGLKGSTTAEQLLAVLARRWSRFTAQTGEEPWIVPQCPELDPAQRQVAIDPLMLYQLMATLDARYDTDPSVFEDLAESYGIEAFVIREWGDRVAEMSLLETARGTSRIRYRRTQKKVLPKNSHEKTKWDASQAPYAPSSDIFPAPPRTKRQKAEVQALFQRLQRIHEDDPDFVHKVLSDFLQNLKRSQTLIKFKSFESKRDFLRLLDMLSLKRWAFVRVNLGLDKDLQEARRFWAVRFEVPKSRVLVSRTGLRLTERNPKGVAHIDLHADETGKRMLWDVVRFVLTAAIVCLPPASMVGGILPNSE
ncbi:site-specific integrase [Hydrocarboniclastica marina]|uniref:Site-specific integrase n=2 Tax=Hydrocarboniclastica marina TaxID=2259620 RepID=A0A4P7XMP1_9ALTE|nr:site-specific integrase [Hydrocarboniclastica marina]